MDSPDDQPIGVDVRLPLGIVAAFRKVGQQIGRRNSALAELMVQELLASGEITARVPGQFVGDRRLTLRLEAATHASLADIAASKGVSVRALLRLAIEQGLQRRGQL